MKAITAYKFVGKDLINNGFKWKVGKWCKVSGKLELCHNRFHASREPIDVLEYTSNGERLFMVEARGEILNGDDKFCSSEMRLVKEVPNTVLRWFAIACAKHVLKYWTKEYPNDKRPAEAIQAAEDYLNGKITIAQLNEKEDAAWDAARAAAWAAWAAWDAWDAARAAAWAAWAAWDAAWDAARAAAWAAWAAWDAARDAAWDAARDAWAAWDAARDAAWAARDAEQKWQNKILKQLIKEAIL
jgi:hypothetical protein